MIYLACILGAIIGGLVTYNWCQSKNTAQLQSLADLLDYRRSENTSVSVVSQLWRSAINVNRQRQGLEQQLQNWQEIWQFAPIGYLQLDAENQIVWCNTQAQRLLHIADWQPDRLRLLLEIVRSIELDRLVMRTRQQQACQELEWQFFPSYDNQPGDSLATMLRAHTVFLPDRSVAIFIENRQQLAAMSQARQRWTTDLAHELRTPLTSMRLAAETIQGKVEPPFDKWTDRMLLEIDRLAKLVQDFLDLSQIEDPPSKSVRRSLVNLSDLIDDAWQGLEPLARQNAVTLVQKGNWGIQLSADASRLMQVFINIFDNALKYSPRGGQIAVDIDCHADMVEIAIIDEGEGFAANDLPYVFDRLFRGDVSRLHTSDISGNGLGLAIVKQIILAHGGIVTAQNHPSKGGGWVQIKLPIEPIN